MSATGRLGGYYWAEISGELLDVGDVVRLLGPQLRGLRAVNVSWDSGKLQDLAPVPAGWSIHDSHVVSPPLDDAIMGAWPQSACNSGRFDEWYFFRALPARLDLQGFCKWGGVSLAGAAALAYPGGFDLAGQLAAYAPNAVVGEGSALFVIAADEASVQQLVGVESSGLTMD